MRGDVGESSEKAATREWEKFREWTEKEHGTFRVWMQQFEALDRKAAAIITLDGMLLALTATFVGTYLGPTMPVLFKVVLGASTGLILISAGTSASALWVNRWLTETIGLSGGVDEAFVHFRGSRSWKTRSFQASIGTLMIGLTGYAVSTLVLLAR